MSLIFILVEGIGKVCLEYEIIGLVYSCPVLKRNFGTLIPEKIEGYVCLLFNDRGKD